MKTIHTKWGNAKVDHSGYYRISSTKEGNYRKSLARLIYEDNFGKIPNSHTVYHKNGDKTDNSLDNLGLRLKTYAIVGDNHPFKGKHLSKEHVRKIVESNRKTYASKPKPAPKPKPEPKILSEEEKRKISINYSKKHSSTGYYRVNKSKDSRRKQGHYWRYRWIENKKVKSLCAPTIDELERKVRSKGLEWIKF